MNSVVNVEFVQGSYCTVTGTRITTLVLEYPRIIHSQLLTHRVFSKNSSSSRAVPIKTATEQISANPAKFMWTSNKRGMQGEPINDPHLFKKVQKAYSSFLNTTMDFVRYLGSPLEEGGLNIHKQHSARFAEPFQNIRVCLTSTEWENWDWLRVDSDAQPEIAVLAEKIKEARDTGFYMPLKHGEWHVPFVHRERDHEDRLCYYGLDNEKISLDDAILISISAAAQTSYRKADLSLEKAKDMKSKLFAGKKVHASPTEHQATPIGVSAYVYHPESDAPAQAWVKGITHMDRYENYWSGNFRHFIQYRQLVPGHDPAKD